MKVEIEGEEKVRPDFCLGIDPGLSGALCLLRLVDKQIDIFDMPVTDGRVDPAKLAGIVEMCKLRGSIVAAVENVSSMPRQAGAFNFGRSAGVVHGVLGALGVPPAKLAGIVEMCKLRGSIVAAVENVSSMPRQAGAFNFGRSAGVVHGVLGALGVPMELVSPNIWKGAMGLRKLAGETQDANKTRARELAQKLWPSQADLFKRVKDDGRAEACLIARYYANSKGY